MAWSWWPFPRKVVEAHTAALSGAGSSYIPNGDSVEVNRSVSPQGWQTQAWRLWRELGELHSPTSYIARIISRRMEWTVTDAITDAQLDTAGVLSAAMGRTSLEEFIRLFVLNMQVAGEFWLIQTVDGWDIVSVVAPKLNERIKEAKAAGLQVKRVYDPDPADTDYADCSVRTVLGAGEELLTLSALSRAQSRSRIAQAGLLLVPSEQQFTNGDPFGAGLEQAMTAAISDVCNPSALAPIKVTMSKDLIESVRHLTLDRPYDDKISEKVDKCIRRIALGLDLPPELLMGLGENSSHWGAWAVQEESYRGTIAPLADQVAGILEWIVAVTSMGTVNITPDPTQLLARKSSVRDAIDGATIGAVGLQYVRDALGAHDEDAPTPQDIEIMNAARGTTPEPASTVAPVDQTQAAPRNADPEV